MIWRMHSLCKRFDGSYGLVTNPLSDTIKKGRCCMVSVYVITEAQTNEFKNKI